jgi:4-amino-4-deoxy-L-arabinose transferase-like glycosyltransferase
MTMRTRYVLAAMCTLQTVWLCAIWMAGITSGGPTLLKLAAGAVALAVVMGRVPASLWSAIARFKKRQEASAAGILGALCAAVAVAGTWYALYQSPLPDEESALAAARIVAEQGVAAFLAQYARIEWLGIQHPPLVTLVSGLLIGLVGDSLFTLRLVSLAFLIGTLVTSYLLGRRLYDPATGLLAAASLTLLPYSFRVGLAARTDMAVTFFVALALLLALQVVNRTGRWPIIATGLAIGGAILSKYTGVLVLPVLLALLIVYGASRDAWMRMTGAIVVAALVVSPWIVFAYQSGVFELQKQTIALYVGGAALNEGAVHHLSPLRFQIEILTTNLPSGIGVYNLAVILPGVWILVRRRLASDLAVLAWITVVSLLLLLTLPDSRYFMLMFPAMAILMARSLHSVRPGMEPVLGLAMLYCGQSLYLYMKAVRTAFLIAR